MSDGWMSGAGSPGWAAPLWINAHPHDRKTVMVEVNGEAVSNASIWHIKALTRLNNDEGATNGFAAELRIGGDERAMESLRQAQSVTIRASGMEALNARFCRDDWFSGEAVFLPEWLEFAGIPLASPALRARWLEERARRLAEVAP